jgi:hypothetical protein
MSFTPYLEVCKQALEDAEAYAVFKRRGPHRRVVETVMAEDGQRYLDVIVGDYPYLVGLLDWFQDNDKVGGARTYNYPPFGDFSPTTLRYIKILGDLLRLFGPLEVLDILEIGGGYGGQCFTIARYGGFWSYTLVELDPAVWLAKKYLRELGVRGVEYSSSDMFERRPFYDLVISNYAFSECSRAQQEKYLDALRVSKRGYLICNVMPRRMAKAELLAAIPGSTVMPEVPRTASGNYVLVWGGR